MKIHIVCFTVTGSFLITIICLAVWISLAESNKLPKQMNGNQKDQVTVKHTKWIFTDIGKVMMVFILATDFDFIAYMSKMASFFLGGGGGGVAFFVPMAFLEYDLLLLLPLQRPQSTSWLFCRFWKGSWHCEKKKKTKTKNLCSRFGGPWHKTSKVSMVVAPQCSGVGYSNLGSIVRGRNDCCWIWIGTYVKTKLWQAAGLLGD